MHRKIALLAGVAAIAGSAPAFADAGGNTIRGEAYSRGMCSSCHATAQADTSKNPAAKPFREIKLSYDSGEAFAKWLNTAHPVIPSTMVTASQAEDIMTYVATLKKPE